MMSQALGHNAKVLWLLEIGALAFVGIGAFILSSTPPTG
jgi:serine acetyltransferase